MSINDADQEQSMFYHNKRAKHNRKPVAKKDILKNLDFLLNEREKALNSFKVNIVPMKVVDDDGREEHHQPHHKNQPTTQVLQY